MRKKLWIVIFAGIFCWFIKAAAPSYALTVDSLRGEEFMVLMWCDDDAGDYCDQGDIVVEEFIFDDNSRFFLGTYESSGFGTGSYDENGFFFEANFEAIDNLIKTYEFDILGFNVSDTVILGMNEVTYKNVIGLGDDEKANCYFIGLTK